jgi:hypothetical protein
LQQQNQAKLIAKIIKMSALAQNISLYTKHWRLPKILTVGLSFIYIFLNKLQTPSTTQ